MSRKPPASPLSSEIETAPVICKLFSDAFTVENFDHVSKMIDNRDVALKAFDPNVRSPRKKTFPRNPNINHSFPCPRTVERPVVFDE
jgi:hypothetical protein